MHHERSYHGHMVPSEGHSPKQGHHEPLAHGCAQLGPMLTQVLDRQQAPLHEEAT